MSKMISYEEVDKQQLIDWIEAVHDALDEKGVKDNEHNALYSVYGRLGFYIKDTDAKIAALTTRLQEAEAMLQEASKKLNEKYAYVALEWATPDVAQAHADVLTHKYEEFLKGGTN